MILTFFLDEFIVCRRIIGPPSSQKRLGLPNNFSSYEFLNLETKLNSKLTKVANTGNKTSNVNVSLSNVLLNLV